jgi:glycosyltransferase involved in cell wall biosynthesis
MSEHRRRVVILDQVSGYAQIDILEALKTEYDECILIAGEIKERNKTLPKEVYWDKIIGYSRNTFYQRIYTWMIGTFQMFWKVLFKYRDARIIAISNPPFAIFIPWLLRCNYDVVIYDIYPDALVHMKYLKPTSWMVRLWEKLNKRVFSGASRVMTLSDGMKRILSNYAQPDKIEVIPNWSFNSSLPQILKQNNTILKKIGVTNKFIISYSGNFGMTHPLEVLVELASKLDPKIFQVIVSGDGARKPIIEKAIENFKPKNFSLLPWQPADQLHHVLSMGDLGVVVLDDTAANISIPSKTYDLLSAGTPILGICSEVSSLSILLKYFDCGVSMSKDDLSNILNFLKKVEQDPKLLKNLAKNALQASKDFTSKNAMQYV